MPRTPSFDRKRVRGIAALGVLLALFLTVMVTASGQVAAQEQANNSTSAQGVQIDQYHRLVESSYENGTARLVFESDRPEDVTLVDQFAPEARNGGVIPTRTVVLDGRTVIEMPASKWNGRVAVSISTDRVLYSEVVVSESPESVQDSLGGATPTQAWIGGAGIAIFYFLIAAFVELRQEGTAPEVAT